MRNPLLLLKRRRRHDEDFADEIAAHLALEADRLVAEGLAPDEAAFEARRRFGNVGLARERFHRGRTIGWVEAFPRGLRRAARRLARAPVFTGTAALTLMLGIGATTAVFSLVDGVLLRPLPFARPQELVDLSHTLEIHGLSRVDESDATYLYYRRANRVFSGVGAYRTVSVNLGAGRGDDPDRAERVEAARASASLFRVLGMAPLLGRVFRDAEDRPGVARVVVLGERLWKGRYAGDPRIVGRGIMIDGLVRQVIGVMPERFAFPDRGTALWLPIGIDPAAMRTAAFDYHAVARLRAGITAAAAAADLQALLPHVPDAFPGRLTAGGIRLTHMRPVVRPLRQTIVGDVGRTLWVVFGAAAFLLLVACANVANLLLVRGEERHHDLVVRRALGAGRGAIVGEFLAEGVLLAVVGGALGLALAAAGLGALRSLGSGIAIPRLPEVRLDGAVLGAAAGITLLTAVVVSLVPALRSEGPEIGAILAHTGRGTTADRKRHRARRAFVIVQVALALVLVTGAGLMARTFRALRSVPPGFDATGVTTFRVALSDVAYPTTGAVVGLVTQAQESLSALPGVRAVGVVTRIPLDQEAPYDTAVLVEDRPLGMGQMPDIHQIVYATPGAFAALGVPFLQGRPFENPDPARAPLEVVVTHALAARYWGRGGAVGRRLRLDPTGPLFTVVGVTGDIRGDGLDRPPDQTVFLPLVTAPGAAGAGGGEAATRWAPRHFAFVVRSTDGAGRATPQAERVLGTLAPDVPLYDVRSMSEVVARSTARTTFTMELLEISSLAALLIGAVGLYGLLAYLVGLRARELAVRLALGAEPRALRRQVLGQAMALAAIGIVLGLGATVVLTRSLTALLFDVAPDDPVTLAGAIALMCLVAVAASWLPARRAAAIDPATALRADV